MSNFLRLLGRRLIALPIMILGVTILVFVILQFTPGDPATIALGEGASEEAKEAYGASTTHSSFSTLPSFPGSSALTWA